MKPGLRKGQTAEAEIIVSVDMRASFEGKIVHDLYCTSALVHHMEWVARKVILEYLEPSEEGMGIHVEVSHLMPTLPNMKVHLRASVADVRDNRIVCDVEAFNSRGRIARGSITQAVVQRSWLENKQKELSLIEKLASEADKSELTPNRG